MRVFVVGGTAEASTEQLKKCRLVFKKHYAIDPSFKELVPARLKR